MTVKIVLKVFLKFLCNTKRNRDEKQTAVRLWMSNWPKFWILSFFRRTHPELATSLLHPEGQRPVYRLQEGANVGRWSGGSAEQLHRQELPDPALGSAQTIHLHCPWVADDDGRRKNVLRQQWGREESIFDSETYFFDCLIESLFKIYLITFIKYFTIKRRCEKE